MSLHVYDWVDEKEGKIPVKTMKYNDWYFNKNTLLKNTTEVKSILSLVEKAEYFDANRFKTWDGCTLYRECLSTGSKTAINVASHPNVCFDSLECGENAMYACLVPSEGYVIWHGAQFDEIYDVPCDLIYKGIRYTSVSEFLTAFDER